MCCAASDNADENQISDTSVVPPCPPASGYVMADTMTGYTDSGEYL